MQACYHDNAAETPVQTADTIWRLMQTDAAL